jgi:hypothetical protein
MENRRSFFRELAAFATGVVATKVASYTPKKEKEEVLVTNAITIHHDGQEYHPVVVKKTVEDNLKEATRSKPEDNYIYSLRGEDTKNRIRKLGI